MVPAAANRPPVGSSTPREVGITPTVPRPQAGTPMNNVQQTPPLERSIHQSVERPNARGTGARSFRARGRAQTGRTLATPQNNRIELGARPRDDFPQSNQEIQAISGRLDNRITEFQNSVDQRMINLTNETRRTLNDSHTAIIHQMQEITQRSQGMLM